jgi:hypothetical protein
MHTLLSLALLVAPATAAPPDVLLLGNSYVEGGQLDLVVGDVLPLVHPDGGEPDVERRAAGGLRLVDHLSRVEGADPRWADALAPGLDRWDVVVLQEQSQIPGFPADHAEVLGSREAALALDGHIAAHSGETVFLATWGRRDGDRGNPDRYPDFQTMNDLLLEGYLAYAEDATEAGRRATLAPVGLAFAQVWAADEAAGRDPTEAGSDFHALYAEDGSHPSMWGTYLAALTVSVSLSGYPAAGRPAPAAELEGERGAALQAAADAAVLGAPFAVPLRFTRDWSEVDTGEEVTIADDWMRLHVGVAEATGPRSRVTLGAGGDDAVLWVLEDGDLQVEALELGGGRLVVDGGRAEVGEVGGSGRVAVQAGTLVVLAGTAAGLDVSDAGNLSLASAGAGAELVVSGEAAIRGELVVEAVSGDEEDVLLEAGSLDVSAARYALPDGVVVGTKALPDGRVALVAAPGDAGDDAGGTPAAASAGEAGGCGCTGVAGVGGIAPALLGLLVVARRRA